MAVWQTQVLIVVSGKCYQLCSSWPTWTIRKNDYHSQESDDGVQCLLIRLYLLVLNHSVLIFNVDIVKNQ